MSIEVDFARRGRLPSSYKNRNAQNYIVELIPVEFLELHLIPKVRKRPYR